MYEVQGSWTEALSGGFRDWARTSVGYLVRLGPLMVVAGFASGLAIQWISPDTVARYFGNDLQGVAIAATLGILINVPLLFEIPLVALGLMLGMGTAPAAALLFTAAAGGPVTFWGLAQVIPKRAIASFATATWILGAAGGLAVMGIGAFLWDSTASASVDASAVARGVGDSSAAITDQELVDVSGDGPVGVVRFTNEAHKLFGGKSALMSRFPGVAIFDYDRDGDHDIYITQAESDAPIKPSLRADPTAFSETMATARLPTWPTRRASPSPSATAAPWLRATSTTTATRIYMLGPWVDSATTWTTAP